MATGFAKYYAATVDGVVRVETRQPVVKLIDGPVINWDCLNLEYSPDNSEHPRFFGVPTKFLFKDPEAARKAVFKLKLVEER